MGIHVRVVTVDTQAVRALTVSVAVTVDTFDVVTGLLLPGPGMEGPVPPGAGDAVVSLVCGRRGSRPSRDQTGMEGPIPPAPDGLPLFPTHKR